MGSRVVARDRLIPWPRVMDRSLPKGNRSLHWRVCADPCAREPWTPTILNLLPTMSEAGHTPRDEPIVYLEIPDARKAVRLQPDPFKPLCLLFTTAPYRKYAKLKAVGWFEEDSQV